MLVVSVGSLCPHPFGHGSYFFPSESRCVGWGGYFVVLVVVAVVVCLILVDGFVVYWFALGQYSLSVLLFC